MSASRTKKPIDAMTEPTSKERLLQCAAQFFGEHGFTGASVRDIATAANANPALVGYHFGGKEGLLAAVYTRHCEPLNQERARMLAEVNLKAAPPPLEKVLEAFILPSLRAAQGSEEGRSFSRLRAILSAENSSLLEELVAHNFDKSTRSFIDALCKCLPELRREDIFWRFHFLLGTIYYTAVGPNRIHVLSRGKCDPGDIEAMLPELIRFAAAGFRAPSTGARPTGPRKRKSTQTKTARA